MSKDIGVDANINRIRIKEVASPSTPASGYGYIYAKTDGLYFKGDNGTEVGPLAAASTGLTNSSITPTTSNVTATIGTRYFADISGLTANRNFVLPACSAGNEIELKITTGDDTYALIIIGDTGVSIDGGSTATEWSRLLTTGESVRLVANGTNSWSVVYDGRIPCHGQMTLSAADTTNSAGTATLPTWDNAVINVGSICDLTNKRFNIRRAGKYRISGDFRSNSNVADQAYVFLLVYINGTGGTLAAVSDARQSGSSTAMSSSISSRSVSCAVGDYLDFYYQPQGANVGASATKTFFEVLET